MKKVLAVLAAVFMTAFSFAEERTIPLDFYISPGIQYQNLNLGFNDWGDNGRDNLKGLNYIDLEIWGFGPDNFCCGFKGGFGYLDSDKFVMSNDAGAFTAFSGSIMPGYAVVNQSAYNLTLFMIVNFNYLTYDGEKSFGGVEKSYTHEVKNEQFGLGVMGNLFLSKRFGIMCEGGVMTSFGGDYSVYDRRTDKEYIGGSVRTGGMSYFLKAGVTFSF